MLQAVDRHKFRTCDQTSFCKRSIIIYFLFILFLKFFFLALIYLIH